MKNIMEHNGDTGELVCYAPAGTEIFRTVEHDILKAHDISNAIQKAYYNGVSDGQLRLQRAVERCMIEFPPLRIY